MRNLLSMMFIFLLGSVFVFTGCKKEEDSILGSIEVTVAAAANYSVLPLSGLEVVLTNTIDNTTTKVSTDLSGKALFIDLAPGTYTASCSLKLTDVQAFEYTGYKNELTLNAAKENIVLLAKQVMVESITMDGKAGGSLIIKEIYSTGAAGDNYTIMLKDQFFEIYNNSDELQYVDKLYVAYLAPQRAGASPATEVVSTLPIGEFVYASKILQFPGNGTTYPIEPGKSIRVAINAINYQESQPTAYTTDNSKANFDTYAITWLQSLGRTGSTYFDVDNPNVPTMKCIYLFVKNNGFFSLDNSASLALLKLDADPAANTVLDPDLKTAQVYYVKLPASAILDGVDVLENSSAVAYKRLPSTIDAGFTYALELGKSNYTGKSVRRKISKTLANGRVVLSDTNNSSNDFKVDFVTVH
jgi:hypothetical protein